MIIKLVKKITISLFTLALVCSCDDVNGKLDQYLEEGPIIYTGKIDSLIIESGYYRARVNLYAAPDANLSYANLVWNKGANSQKIYYDETKSLYDEDRECFYAILDFTEDALQGNVFFEAVNYDRYENKSISLSRSKLIYGDSYRSGLTNTLVNSITNKAWTGVDSCAIAFDPKVGLVGTEITYETPLETVTERIFENEVTLGLKPGTTALSYKSLYHINSKDLDTLITTAVRDVTVPVAL
jgi:hypothetical protein